RLLDRVAVHVDAGDHGPLLGQADRARAADPRTGSGDDADLVGDPIAHDVLLSPWPGNASPASVASHPNLTGRWRAASDYPQPACERTQRGGRRWTTRQATCRLPRLRRHLRRAPSPTRTRSTTSATRRS